MNLNLTNNIQMPNHELRRQVIELCEKVQKPLLKLSTKDYVENGLGHLVEQFDGQAGLVNIEVFNELPHTMARRKAECRRFYTSGACNSLP